MKVYTPRREGRRGDRDGARVRGGACTKDNVGAIREVISIPVRAELDSSEISAVATALRAVSFESGAETRDGFGRSAVNQPWSKYTASAEPESSSPAAPGWIGSHVADLLVRADAGEIVIFD